jgi:hypothetical protein
MNLHCHGNLFLTCIGKITILFSVMCLVWWTGTCFRWLCGLHLKGLSRHGIISQKALKCSQCYVNLKSHNLFLSFILFEIVHMNRVWVFCMIVHNLYSRNILEVFYSKTKYRILINFVNTINIHNQQRVAVSIVMGCDPCDIVGKCWWCLWLCLLADILMQHCHWIAVVSANFLLAERVYALLFYMT